MEKLIITAAVIGSAPTKEKSPYVPYRPSEIAEEALRCWRAGAAVVHVHVRDPETGEPAFEKELFAEVVERVRAGSDMLINLTTSGFNISGPDVGEKRLMPLDLKPDLCSLDIGSMNFRGKVFVNPPEWGEMAAKRMREARVKPEIETFDLGHVAQARHLTEQGLLDDPPYFQLCLGIAWGADADLESLLIMKAKLPAGSKWSVLSPGPAQLPMTTHALLLGGHVRVGFEDNLYLSRGVQAETNAQFVDRTVRLARELQREVATCEEARSILNIRPEHNHIHDPLRPPQNRKYK
ncbi:MAG: 3-keto-5-aminohexanoate cleavage protein [Desulfobacteraceae bacterium]|nr:3-keto-5-aminohexanoate cleavage protein [Desulfobacteraceae bacterium]